MSIFDFTWGQVVWTICMVLVSGGVIAGVVFIVRYFIRLDRRLDDLTRDVSGRAEGRSEADVRNSRQRGTGRPA